MSRIVCTRVACLRLPWFPIDVLHRAGHVAKGSPVAVVRGQGSHARVSDIDPAGHTLGLRRGMRPSRARALVADLQLIPWDEGLVALLEDATEALTRALEHITPRRTVVAPGRWWLEPAALKRSASSDDRTLEEAFARRVLTCVTAQGFPGARVGIADGPVAATAATRVGGSLVQYIAPGEDARYLGGLPITALPLSERTVKLLDDLGLRTVSALQAMHPQALEARLGPEGRRAWRVARGHDPRRPRSPTPRATTRIVLPLVEGCEEIEPLLFVLRPALERLVAAHTRRGRAIARLGLTLERAWGAPHTLVLTPSHPISEPGPLLTLAHLRLRALRDDAEAVAAGPVVTLILDAHRATPRHPRQADLFTASNHTIAAAEGAIVQLTGRLGPGTVGVPIPHDAHRPERAGSWRPLREPPSESKAPGQGSTTNALPGCLRLLPAPRALQSGSDTPEQIGLGDQVLHPDRWMGPERLSGDWWMASYDRDYYWVSTREGRALWLFRDRESGSWYLHGWLD